MELIIVMAVMAILASAFFVSTKPQKRIGETNDAKRKNDAQAIEQAIKVAATDNTVAGSDLKALTENTAYAIVKAGGSTSGTYSCTALGSSINKADISSSLLNYLPAMPVDPELSSSSNETGYYIIRRGSAYDVEPCNTYRLAATTGSRQMCGDSYCGSTESCSSCPQDCGVCPAVCGNHTTEGSEVCDDGNITTETCGDSTTQSGSYCNATCFVSLYLTEQCDDGNSSNLDSCLNTCVSASCGDTYCNGSETCSNCSGDCGACQQAYTAGPNYATSGIDAGGGVAWATPGNIISDNTTYAKVTGLYQALTDNAAKLIKSNGSYSTQDKSSLIYWPGSLSINTYGGAGDLWGESWTPNDINSSNFGFVMGLVDSVENSSSLLKAQNFGFSIPVSATITGIKVEVNKYNYTTGKPSYLSQAWVDSVKITVYYNN